LAQIDISSFSNLLPPALRGDVKAALDNPFTSTVKSVEFWSNLSPPVFYTGKQLDDIYRDPTPNPYLAKLQPVIVVDSTIGRKVIAPYGVPPRDAWRENTQKTALLIGGAVIFGTASLLIVGAALGRARKRG
jgi:hypothetical protein